MWPVPARQLLPTALPKCYHLPRAPWQPLPGNSSSGAPLSHASAQGGAPGQQCLLDSKCRASRYLPACRCSSWSLLSHVLIQMLILWTPL